MPNAVNAVISVASSLGPALESWKFFQNKILVLPVIEDQEHEREICVEVKRELQ